MSWQLWRQTLRVAGHVPKMSVICVQFVPNLSPGDKFGINLGQIGDTRRDTRRDTTMSLKWVPTSVTAFIIFGAQGSPKRRPKTDFWTLLGNMWKRKSIAPACTGASFLRFGGSATRWILLCDVPWPSESQVSLKWVKWVPFLTKWTSSEPQVSAQVFGKWVPSECPGSRQVRTRGQIEA